MQEDTLEEPLLNPSRDTPTIQMYNFDEPLVFDDSKSDYGSRESRSEPDIPTVETHTRLNGAKYSLLNASDCGD